MDSRETRSRSCCHAATEPCTCFVQAAHLLPFTFAASAASRNIFSASRESADHGQLLAVRAAERIRIEIDVHDARAFAGVLKYVGSHRTQFCADREAEIRARRACRWRPCANSGRTRRRPADACRRCCLCRPSWSRRECSAPRRARSAPATLRRESRRRRQSAPVFRQSQAERSRAPHPARRARLSDAGVRRNAGSA